MATPDLTAVCFSFHIDTQSEGTQYNTSTNSPSIRSQKRKAFTDETVRLTQPQGRLSDITAINNILDQVGYSGVLKWRKTEDEDYRLYKIQSYEARPASANTFSISLQLRRLYGVESD